ncbi:hypothetical protein BV372_16290 [Nostoc sp. T09]|uniref:hypothetical protein n=1 Tax=Nostoc sp. T09 TaxID=1932621 RepID=UPI000A3BF031|nr:hypothetical protein [Nostoc sp. T09]OUL33482.1 hypothetical protein BV372_16290 [Nostoc sp. T09]
MVPTNVLDLAKQGNADAIASLINYQMQSQGITAKVTLQDNCIYVLLESATVPDQKTVAPFIFNGIIKLAIEIADSLQVYGRRTGEKRPTWSQVYSLSEAKSSTGDRLAKNTQDITTEDKSSSQFNSLGKVALSGSLDTISTHLNRVLIDEKVNIEIIPEDKLLKIIAETDRVLDGSVFAERIYQELKNFNLSEFETIEIYKKKLKSGQCFQLKAFVLASSQQETSESKNPKELITHTQRVATIPQKTNQIKPQPQKGNKPKLKIGRILGVVVIVVVAAFIIIRLLKRIIILVLLSPALGSFSVFLSIFFLWRSYPFLMLLFQQLLRLLVAE